MKLHQCRPHNFYRAFGSKLVVSVKPHNPFVNNTNLCYPLKIEMRHFRSLDVISVHEMAVALPSNKDTTTRLKFRKLLIPAKWWKYQSDQNLKWIDHQTRIERRIDCTQKRVDFLVDWGALLQRQNAETMVLVTEVTDLPITWSKRKLQLCPWPTFLVVDNKVKAISYISERSAINSSLRCAFDGALHFLINGN